MLTADQKSKLDMFKTVILFILAPGVMTSSSNFPAPMPLSFKSASTQVAELTIGTSVSGGGDSRTSIPKARRPPFFGLDLDDPEV